MHAFLKQKAPAVDRFILSAGAFFFRHRNALFPLIFAVIILVLKPAVQFGSSAADRLLTAAGIIITLSGALVRLAVIGFAYIKRGGKGGKVYADDLVVEGLYAHCRNPMYLGNMLITAGICVIYGSVLMYTVIIPFFFLVYLCIVYKEEDYLLNRFGSKFDDYCATVPRFAVRLKGMTATFKDGAYDWRKVLRKEYGTLTGLLAGILFLPAWKSCAVNGYRAAQAQISCSLLLFLPVILFYTIVRTLKRSGKLGSG